MKEKSNRQILKDMDIGQTLEWPMEVADSISATAAALKKHGYNFKRLTTDTGYRITRIK